MDIEINRHLANRWRGPGYLSALSKNESKEALEFNREEAFKAANSDYTEVRVNSINAKNSR
jgi:hypothetical protein